MGQSMKEETTGYLFSRVCRRRRECARARLEKIGLYRGQPFVLHSLWQREGRTHSEIAAQLELRPATITNVLQRMERAGLLERRPDRQDQRVSRVYLTDAGREIRGEVEQFWNEMEAETFAGLSQHERELFRGLLQRILENLT